MKKNFKIPAFGLKLRGSRNIVFPASEVYEEIRNTSFKLLKINGFKEVILSSFDYESTFTGSIGEDTDIVQKEMFTFSDKKGRKLALRPEGTACVAKMVFQEEICKNGSTEKIFYWSNMFRYERPQKGRYREFWQLGVEILNNSSKISADCELLYVANSLISKLGVENYIFQINYLGGENTINRYAKDLKNVLSLSFESLCEVCKIRFLQNPLRVIDCDKCGNLTQIPEYDKFLSISEIKYFESVINFLSSMKINFIVNKRLVRGISYYSGLVFECKTVGSKESKSLLGGGRYDSLVSKNKVENEFLSKEGSSVGFAVGIDRLVDFCKQQRILELNKKKRVGLLLISISEKYFLPSFLLKEKIQNCINRFSVEVVVCNTTKNQRIAKLLLNFNPLFSVIYGSKESNFDEVSIVNHSTNNKLLIKKELLISWIAEQLKFQKDFI